MDWDDGGYVSVLYREPKLLKATIARETNPNTFVSVLYREPKLLKVVDIGAQVFVYTRFSALP